jgi:hypothetical protein
MSQKKFIISAFGKKYYGKLTDTINSEKKHMYTFSLGGRNKYCITIALKPDAPEDGYIDNMEYNRACVKDGSLEHKEGTAHLGITAIWVFHTLFPHVKRFTLIDDSHIYCEEDSKQYKLNLAYDYILKYNKTWYEDKFKAQLPQPLMKMYKESCAILDKPLDPFHFSIERNENLKPYEKEYNESKSPREFLHALRTKMGHQYCFVVGKWLTGYFNTLRIDTFKNNWFIDIEDIQKPDKYSISETQDEIRGGGKKQTRKHRRPCNFSIVSGNDEEGNIVGYYSE